MPRNRESSQSVRLHTKGRRRRRYLREHKNYDRRIKDPRMECHYCQKALTETTRTRDHVVARALGGLDIRWNIVWACKKCNGEKANKYSTCACAFCKRTRRRHWERLGIRDPHGAPRGRVRARARKVS